MDLSSARHDLLGVAPAGFVAERDRLAKQLVAEGKKQEAAELRKLRKPAATVWALNQVARREPALIETLLGAGERMVAVHATLARGQASDDFRATSADYRRAIAAVVAAAQEVLESAGHAADPASLRRLERTLEALQFAPPEQQAAAREGELEEELERADAFDTTRFEVTPGTTPPAAAPARPAPAPATPRRSTPAPAARATADPEVTRQAERRRQAEARRAAALDAARAVERTAKAAARAEEDAAGARRRLEAALRALHEAEDVHAAAQQRAEQARTDLAAREASLAEARRSAQDATLASAKASKAAAENDET